MNKTRWTAVLLIIYLFLVIAHLSNFAKTQEFCHPLFNMCYHWEWAFVFIRMLYASIVFPLIAIIIKPPKSGQLLLVCFIFLQCLDALDYYYHYWQTPFRQPIGWFLIVVTAVYGYFSSLFD